MFRIKICGVTQFQDVEAAAAAGADAVGINFHPPSIRFVAAEQAARLAECAAKNGLISVGVFVEHSAAQIAAIADQVKIDTVQLHGSHSLADGIWLRGGGYQVLRVIRLACGPLAPTTISAATTPWAELGFPLLLDADAGSHGGGQGMRLDWDAIGNWANFLATSPDFFPPTTPSSTAWGLAGGLTPETVGTAIAKSKAPAVDVASGVESPRGKKSRHKIDAFVAACNQAWQPPTAG